MNIIYSDPLYTGNLYSDLALYDTSERNLKFLCAKLEDRVHCMFFKVRYNETNENKYFLDKLLIFPKKILILPNLIRNIYYVVEKITLQDVSRLIKILLIIQNSIYPLKEKTLISICKVVKIK